MWRFATCTACGSWHKHSSHREGVRKGGNTSKQASKQPDSMLLSPATINKSISIDEDDMVMGATRPFGPKVACMRVVSGTRGTKKIVDRALFVSNHSAADAKRRSALGINRGFAVQTTFVVLPSELGGANERIRVQYFGHKDGIWRIRCGCHLRSTLLSMYCVSEKSASKMSLMRFCGDVKSPKPSTSTIVMALNTPPPAPPHFCYPTCGI